LLKTCALAGEERRSAGQERTPLTAIRHFAYADERFDNEEEQEWIKSVETFCRTPPAWADLLLPAQRFGASSLFSPKAGQDMNSPR